MQGKIYLFPCIQDIDFSKADVAAVEHISFKEYLELTLNIELQKFTLKEILRDHETLAFDIVTQLEGLDKKILPLFKRYLRVGYLCLL